MTHALVIGGAGFIGSNVVRQMIADDATVTVVDGLLPLTGAKRENLAGLAGVTVLETRLEETPSLDVLLESVDVVVAAFGWTSHKTAFERPQYDLDLNLKSHVYLLEQLRNAYRKPFLINLGSSVQFGNALPNQPVLPDAPQYALDVQGIHKVAAEAYYRIFAGMYSLDVYSLHIPNCFGPAQKTEGDDIGLIGSFVRDALDNKTIDVFGSARRRSVIYVEDVARIIADLARIRPKGFVPLNLPAHHVEISALAQAVVRAASCGSVAEKKLPLHLAQTDTGGAAFDWESLQQRLPQFSLSPLEESLAQTVSFFKYNSNERHNLAL